MQTYEERAAQVASESQIAIQVHLSADNNSIEVWPLRPRMAKDSELLNAEEYTRRQLRPVGVVGLSGLKPLAAFAETLPPQVVTAISAAFLEYVRVFLSGTFMQIEQAEIAAPASAPTNLEPYYDWTARRYIMRPVEA
jgi:hypothetical protein